MAAYVIVELEVLEPEQYKEYQRGVPETLARYRGRFLVRGGAYETIEGEWQPSRIVVLEFPDMAAAKAWYASAEYQAILPLRLRSSRAKFFTLVEGA